MVKNLKSGESFVRNGNMEFLATSLYKLWIMAKVYYLIEYGTLHETD